MKFYLLAIIALLINLAFFGGILYIVWHFISKFW